MAFNMHFNPFDMQVAVEIRTSWTKSELQLLLAGLISYTESVGPLEAGWTDEPWKRLSIEYPAPEKTHYKCRAVWMELKRQCREVVFMRGKPGFSWDHENNLLMASDETWAHFQSENGQYMMQWRDCPFPYLEDVLKVLGYTPSCMNVMGLFV